LIGEGGKDSKESAGRETPREYDECHYPVYPKSSFLVKFEGIFTGLKAIE
jgi:hypothetical protein